MIIVHGGIPVDPSRVDDVSAAALEFQNASRAEAGCVEYQLSWRVGEVDQLRLLEIWESEADHEVHRAAAHTVAWTSFIAAASTAPPEFTRLEV